VDRSRLESLISSVFQKLEIVEVLLAETANRSKKRRKKNHKQEQQKRPITKNQNMYSILDQAEE